MFTYRSTWLVGMVIVLAIAPMTALAQVVTSNPGLPPDTGEYLTAQQVHALYPEGIFPEVILENILHHRFFDIQITPLPSGDESEEFQSFLSGDAEVFQSGVPIASGPVSLQGGVQVLTQGKTGNTTGTFDTEIVAMSLTGTFGGNPIEVRENPNQPSTGQTTITDIGGGLFRIDSFFDVFTEISLDGGQNFTPAAGSVRVDLMPEPATLGLLAFGLGAVVLGRRNRKA